MSGGAKRILLIVAGGIAGYKALEFARLARAEGIQVRSVLTAGGARFVTPLSLAALTEDQVYDDLWSLKDESEMGHIRLSREADLIVVAPCSASRIARMAQGLGQDLADAVYLAADKPVLVAPAMNWRMWSHAATARNVEQLCADGVLMMQPGEGAMACGEYGAGRLPEPAAILAAAKAVLAGALDVPGLLQGCGSYPRSHAGEDAGRVWPVLDPDSGMIRCGDGEAGLRPSGGARLPHTDGGGAAGNLPLAGRHAVVTAGPTHEPIDPVRYLGNRSSGRQGFAIAAALAQAGARVTLVAGPVALPTPPGCTRVDVETAREMAAAVDAALPADIAVMVAAVADWGIAKPSPVKMKKADGAPAFDLVPNPDILAELASPGPRRPRLVIGFAAETGSPVDAARSKLATKNADLIVANDVSGDVMGGSVNTVALVGRAGTEQWPALAKAEVARRLAAWIAAALTEGAA
ncbi:MAG: bifunctional phosphopantothenoylcysteine decarboxylase/phosphopantothenate synthase [Sphingomonadaceae bacterium]|nr:bifunctional phosphopantothenoylcysteine decarboxylase/phosphopantothenate synthase [Sphingomonadaceae bacterium]